MTPLRAAILDTGIDPDHPEVAPVAAGAHFVAGPDGVRRDDDWRDTLGHGTACASLVSRGLRARIELLAARVVQAERGSDPRALAEGLRWAVEQGARVINVSLGAEAWGEESAERLGAACREAVERGAIVIAAAGPPGKRPLPAVLPEVIAVGTAFCPSDVIYAADEGYVRFLARGDLQRVAWIEGRTVLAQGTSLAAAHLSRAVCKILLASPELDREGVLRALAELCVQGDAGFRKRWEERVSAFYMRRSPAHFAFARNVALYPFNKEIHALVRFRDLAPFSIVAIADPPGNRQCGRDAGEILGAGSAGLVVRPDLDGALAEADTLILGHTEAARAMGARHDAATMALRAVEQGKNVVSLSRLDRGDHPELFRVAEERGVSIVDPTLDPGEVREVLRASAENPADVRKAGGRRFSDGRLAALAGAFVRNAAHVQRYDCPVLGVFGTSRSQGKFSVQLALRRALAAMGYRVGQLSTEPTGPLLGASATLPMGYERGAHLGMEVYAELSRFLMIEIKNREQPDVILVGGQSGVVPLDRELDRFGLASMGALTFGAAVQPDACVLVCNVFDPPRHVKRCVAAIEVVLDCPVIALALNDQVWEEHLFRGARRSRLVRLPQGALRDRAAERGRELGLPCHGALGDEEVAKLAGIVVDFFASAGSGEGAI